MVAYQFYFWHGRYWKRCVWDKLAQVNFTTGTEHLKESLLQSCFRSYFFCIPFLIYDSPFLWAKRLGSRYGSWKNTSLDQLVYLERYK